MILIRIISIALVAIFSYIFIKSKFFNEPYTGKIMQKSILEGINFILILIIICTPKFEMRYLDEENDIYNKYLVDAILQGNTSIDLEPSEELKELEDPYDVEQRENVDYSFDTVYYNEKYYVYFGVVPAILLFIPYKIITGSYLSTAVGTIILVVLSIIMTSMIIIEIYKRWFKELPFNMLILFIMSGLISGLYIWNTWRMWAYELTLMSGYFFVQLGLYLILLATRNIKKVNSVYLCMACLSMALAVGCRPTLVLSSALMIPFFIQIFKNTEKKKILKNLMIIVIPYTIVAIPIMIYNYVRFGSIFEFGARYQLTVINATQLSDRIKDIPRGLYQYLIQPLKIKKEFPYIAIDYSVEGFTSNYYNGGIISRNNLA